TPQTLTNVIREIRIALGDRAHDSMFIETVHGRGYAFRRIPLPSRGEFDGDGPGKSMTTLVGRDRELDALRGIWEQALGGQSRLSFVAGEPGIGKTTLVNALVEAITRSDTGHHVSVARGFCVEHHGHGEPYLPFLEAIEDLVAASERRTLLAMLR